MEVKCFRYISVNGIRTVLDQPYDSSFPSIKSENIVRLRAKRSMSDCKDISQPLLWMELKEMNQHYLSVDFTSYAHGAFSKETLYRMIDDQNLGDLPTQELVLRIPKDANLVKTFAELCKNPDLEQQDWVAVFEEYTLRQEDGENHFTKRVRQAHSETGLTKLRFQAACLDLAYVLPFRGWKEITEGRITKNRRHQFEKWKGQFRDLETNIQKATTDFFFPKGMCSTRCYARTQKNMWTLISGSGD